MLENDKALIIPVFETVILPGLKAKLKVNNRVAELIEKNRGNSEFKLVTLSVRTQVSKNSKLNNDDFYDVGTLTSVNSIKFSDKGCTVEVKGETPINIEDITIIDELYRGSFSDFIFEEDLSKNDEITLLQEIKNQIKETGKKFKGAEQFVQYLDNQYDLGVIIQSLIPFMDIGVDDKQKLLAAPSQKSKYLRFRDILVKFRDQLDLQIEISKKMSEKTQKQYRKNLLQEQLKTIKEELDENDGNENKFEEYKAKIKVAEMPVEVEKVALSELKKLERMGLSGSESHIIQNYLDLLIELPWKTEEISEIDLEDARKILDGDHYGLEKVKKLIIQHLAVLKLKKEKQGSILLLVGPPGTGKTSLGKSIAKALNREYVRASLGGVRDEAEIRGHRRTYIGALPGRIINGVKKAKSKNPVFILDEIDKLSASYNGDPFSALLEVLDPEQNNSFSDHYLEVPYDLSDVFFIATANSLNTIPAPLLDRMEIIEISSYTNREKFHIAKDHLIPDVFENHGISNEMLTIDDDVINIITDKYTREAGVRGLQKKITQIVRYSSEKIVSKETEKPFVVTSDNISDILGTERVRHDVIKKENLPGVVTGLAWTPVGGDILFIETTVMKGKGSLILTGQLGDVMKESATISSSLIRSRLFHLIGDFDFADHDIHIHVPSGATPKDGPSAGITLFTSLVSLLTGQRIPSDIAMTGELTLRGDVLPIGGVKEKVLAAHRAGIKHVLLPKDNEKDIKEIPEEVREQLKFSLVETIEDVLKETLGLDITFSSQIMANNFTIPTRV